MFFGGCINIDRNYLPGKKKYIIFFITLLQSVIILMKFIKYFICNYKIIDID
jgi:hypothetical protein